MGKSEFISMNGIADTGAWSNLWGLKNFLEAGYVKNDLCKVSIKISADNKQPLFIIGDSWLIEKKMHQMVRWYHVNPWYL